MPKCFDARSIFADSAAWQELLALLAGYRNPLHSLVFSVVYATTGTWVKYVAIVKKVQSVVVGPHINHISPKTDGVLSSTPEHEVRCVQS